MLKIEYEGLNEFIKKLDNIQIKKALTRGLNKSALLVQRNVKIETPVRTENLRRGWRIKPGNLHYTILNRVYYGPFVNYGTRFIKANPFTERGVEKSKNKVKTIVFNELMSELG